jgi:hypothetical protein
VKLQEQEDGEKPSLLSDFMSAGLIALVGLKIYPTCRCICSSWDQEVCCGLGATFCFEAVEGGLGAPGRGPVEQCGSA